MRPSVADGGALLHTSGEMNRKHAPKAAGCVGLDRARLVGGEAAQAWDAGGDRHGEVEREEGRAAARQHCDPQPGFCPSHC